MRKFYRLDGGKMCECADDAGPIVLFSKPTSDEQRELTSTWGIDEHDLASTLDPDEIARVEVEDDSVMVIWKRPHPMSSLPDQMFNVSSMGMVLASNRLVIVLGDEAPPLEDHRVGAARSLNELVLRIMLATIHHYVEHLKVIRQVSKELQTKLNGSMENAYFLQMFDLSESLVYYRTAIEANGGVIVKLASLAERLGISQDERDLLEDIGIENNQCLRQADIRGSVLAGLMDARGNIINNNMNVLLKNLTVINIVFLPLNLLASVGGMSEFSIWTKGLHWSISYGLFMLALTVLGLATWWILNRRVCDTPRRHPAALAQPDAHGASSVANSGVPPR